MEKENAKNRMTIIKGRCYRCCQPMKVAVTEGDGIMSSYCTPDEFTPSELAFASRNGVLIETQDSKTEGEAYLANTCIHCGAFVGNFYLFVQYIQPADMGTYPSEVFDVE